MTKEEIIKADIKKLIKLFKDLNKDKLKIVLPLLEQACFIKNTLIDLQLDIMINGAVEEYSNGGGQGGRKVSSALQAYNPLIKQYQAIIKQLIDMLPKDLAKIELDEFDVFYAQNK